MTTLGRAVVVQWEVISAMVLRETLTRYGGSRIGYAWALVRPMATIGLFLFMFFLGRTRPMAGMDVTHIGLPRKCSGVIRASF